MQRRLLNADHLQFRDLVRTFIDREIAPYREEWIANGLMPRPVWNKAGQAGLLGLSVPEEYGGAGVADFRYNAVLVEELCRAGALGLGSSFGIHANIVAPYLVRLTTEEQKKAWLPGFASGEIVTALAMTEPEAGSDLHAIRTTAVRHKGGWLINGQKTFITNGVNADLFLVAVKTDPAAGHRGMSLILVPATTPGFQRGRTLQKVGQAESDTAELFFDDAWVPENHLLGQEGRGFYHLMEGLPTERLSVSVMAVAVCETVLAMTVEYCNTRKAFSGRLIDLQHVRFVLAELASEIDIARTYVDRCIEEYNAGTFDAIDAAKAKWWTTELQRRVTDACLQLHGGYGYMREYPVAQAWLDGRVQTIWAGSTETMKEIIGRTLVARPP